MQLLAVLLFTATTTLTSAIAVPQPAARLLKRDGVPVVETATTIASTTNTIPAAPVITISPDRGIMRVDAVDYESTSSTSNCTPASICFDGITCGVRYGACYDKNFCTGSTSFSMPTVTCADATGLTQNMLGRGEKAAAARAG